MKEKGSIVSIIIIMLFIIIVVVVVAYLFFFNERAQIDRSIKPDTSPKTVSLTTRNEIVENGYDLKVNIKPSNNNIISGIVTITATQVSEAAAGVGFSISAEKDGFMKEGLPNLGADSDGTDGWVYTFDTTGYDNGEYFINVIVYPEGGEGNPLGIAQAHVEIKN